MPKSASNFSKCINDTYQHEWGWICVETGDERKFTSSQAFKKCYKLHTKRCEDCAGIKEIGDKIDLTKQELKIMNRKSYISNNEYQTNIKQVQVD